VSPIPRSCAARSAARVTGRLSASLLPWNANITSTTANPKRWLLRIGLHGESLWHMFSGDGSRERLTFLQELCQCHDPKHRKTCFKKRAHVPRSAKVCRFGIPHLPNMLMSSLVGLSPALCLTDWSIGSCVDWLVCLCHFRDRDKTGRVFGFQFKPRRRPLFGYITAGTFMPHCPLPIHLVLTLIWWPHSKHLLDCAVAV
jgi:hypothetical protein